MFPKKGKVFPDTNSEGRSDVGYVETVAVALRAGVGSTHQAVKTVMRWTGADERTIKNWLAGTNGPSGTHLVALLRHSDDVLEACLRLAGRERIITNGMVVGARDKLRELLALLESMADEPD